jgi:type II secretory pathway component PulJ
VRKATYKQRDRLGLPSERAWLDWCRIEVPAAGGFTLLETLVAACVLGLILSAVLGSYRAVTSSIAGLEPRIALEQKGRFFMQRLSRQIRCGYGGRVDQAKRSSPDQKGVKPAASPEQTPPLFRGGPTSSDEAVLQFVTTSSRLSRKSVAGCLTRVSYKVDRGRHALLACEELYGRRGQDKDEDKDWQVVLEDLQDIELCFSNGVEWQTQWDSTVAGGLPRAVRIRLVLQSDQDSMPRCFTSVAALRCGAPRKLGVDVQKPSIAEENREK